MITRNITTATVNWIANPEDTNTVAADCRPTLKGMAIIGRGEGLKGYETDKVQPGYKNH